MDSEGVLVSIDAVDSSNRGVYKCVSCGGGLVAVLGKQRRKHFRHAIVTESCSLETYLHKAAKQLFYETYKLCRKTGKQFKITFERPRKCNHCEQVNCKMPPELFGYDLTRSFKHIKLEKHDGVFIPDLLLSTESDEKLYIEIAVTHSSSQEKISSGAKIIELKIESEEDLVIIDSCCLSEENVKVEFINFDRKEIKGNYSSECRNEVAVFILNTNGTATIKRKYWHEYEELLKDEGPYYKLVESKGSVAYRRELEQAYLDGLRICNCFLCRYHGKPTPRQREETEKSIFCKYLKKLFGSNYATQCDYFKPDKTKFSHCR